MQFPKFTARDLAKAAGKIFSMSPVVGNVTSLMTRHIYLAIESRIHWDRFISLLFPDTVKSELQFWLQNLKETLYSRFLISYFCVFRCQWHCIRCIYGRSEWKDFSQNIVKKGICYELHVERTQSHSISFRIFCMSIYWKNVTLAYR